MLTQNAIKFHVADLMSRIPVLADLDLDRAVVQPLPSLTNSSFKVTVAGRSYVLRIAGAKTGRYIDRAAELHNAGLAAVARIGPNILYADPATGLMLTGFIPEGRALESDDLRSPDGIPPAARLLRRLHDSNLAFRGRMELFPKLDRYLELAAEKGWPPGLDLRSAREGAEAARTALSRHAVEPVPSHVDPVPGNFVRSGSELFLVDWEYSAMADPMWDLATLAIEAEFNGAQDRLLLNAYGVGGTGIARFLLHKASLLLLGSAWAVLQVADGNTNTDFAAFARERLDRHEALCAGLAYRDALAAA